MADGRPHETHDLELVARVAAGDASAGDSRTSDTARAAELRATCATCAVLHADLRAIAAATRALGGSTATLRAPRDFRLTAADASRLRPNGVVPRIAALFGSPRLARSRAGAGLMALGLVGMLAASGLPDSLFSSLGVAGGGATGATRAQASPGSAFAPLATDARALDSATPPGDFDSKGPGIAPAPTPSSSGPLLLAGASLVALAIGAWLLIAGRREHRSGP